MALWALVTGASEGLGREFAILAAKSGFDVILTARQAAKLEDLAGILRRAYHVAVVVIPADLTDPEAVEQLWLDASAGRQIAVLVNNAGLGHNGTFADEAGWGREAASISVNVVAATILMKRAVAHMVAAGSGRVLNVVSTAAFMPGPYMAVYHATKAYFLSLSDAVAEELRGTGVTVTALCPGATQTNFFAAGAMEGAFFLTKLPMPTADSVAQAGWNAMESGRRVKVTGVMNVIFANLPRLMPRRIISFFTAVFMKRRG
ncbi:MAG: SDR family oxidoreductase [Paracoccaceae bacterium]|nr:SDR family oxidoreductase [Paracoccaceae bacterium]